MKQEGGAWERVGKEEERQRESVEGEEDDVWGGGSPPKELFPVYNFKLADVYICFACLLKPSKIVCLSEATTHFSSTLAL